MMEPSNRFARVRALIEGASSEAANILDDLFVRERTVAGAAVERAIGAQAVQDLSELGLVRRTDNTVIGLARVTTFRGAIVASDRLGFRRHATFVVGPGAASSLLADAVRPPQKARVLDLGSGPGTQALWLGAGEVEVLGVDVNPRALRFADFNRDLNGRNATTFAFGDFLTVPADPGLDERFDVVVANPPFVLAPSSDLLYRDRPLPGNETSRIALERAMRAAAPGGRAYVLGSWFDHGGGAWDDAPRSWLPDRGAVAALVRVASMTPDAYASLWNRDLPEPRRTATVASWVAALRTEGAARIHIGLIAVGKSVHRSARRTAALEVAGPQTTWPAVEATLASGP